MEGENHMEATEKCIQLSEQLRLSPRHPSMKVFEFKSVDFYNQSCYVSFFKHIEALINFI